MAFYPRFKFRVPLGEHGDIYDRLMMRVLEMRESRRNLEAGIRTSSCRPDHRSEGEDPRLSSRRLAKLMAALKRPKVSSVFI